MFAVIGVAGLIGIQQWAHREDAKQRAATALKSALKAASRTARLSTSSDRRSVSSDSSRCSFQHVSRGSTLRDGAFVCFKDRTGQVAVIQPYGNGGSWQLTVTCAAGGCCLLPEGSAHLAHITGDAVFLVRQVGSNFAFASPGAEGRYLSAVRDLNVAPVLDSTKLTAAAQWKVTGQGISNVMHPHKKLSYSVAEVKLVPVESIAAVERSIADFNKTQQDKVHGAEALIKSLQIQLQESAAALAATTADYESQVECLQGQLGEACSFNTQLTGLIETKDTKLGIIKEHFSAIKAKYQEAERELSTAYAEVAALQQQLAERDDDVCAIQQRMMLETQQWSQLRSTLQDSLTAKDEEITALSLQVQRMEHALCSVEHTLYGMRKPSRLDRASLDLVSISQLQAAVNNFAAVGEGGLSASLALGLDHMSTEEAEALRVLLEEQSESAAAAAAGRLPPSALLYLEPSRELSLQDLDTLDQTSPGKHDRYTAAAAAAGTGGAGATCKAGKPPRHAPSAAAAAAAGAAASGGAAAKWGLRGNAAALSRSSGARCSSNEGSKHRYAGGDTSDCDSQDGDDTQQQQQQQQQHSEADAAAASAAAAGGGGGGGGPTGGVSSCHVDGSDFDDAAVCTSMDEDELQHQLGRLTASASQLSVNRNSSSSSRPAPHNSVSTSSSSKQQQQQALGPLHAMRPVLGAAAAAAAAAAAGGGRPYASLTQLSPVKEEALGHKIAHTRSKSSVGAPVRHTNRYN